MKYFLVVFVVGLLSNSGWAQADVYKKLERINRKVQRGGFDNLNNRELNQVNRNLENILRILRGNGSGNSNVMCVPANSFEYNIVRINDNRVIGDSRRGDDWCASALEVADYGDIVCAPSGISKFAFYKVSTGMQIGDEARDFAWCNKDKVSGRQKIVCAPSGISQFAIYRISDGVKIGDDTRGSDWCDAVIESSKNGIVCAPNGISEFAYFRINDGVRISEGRRGHGWCTHP